MKTKWIWICVALAVALLAIVTWSRSVGSWTWLFAALLLVCPILALWVRQESRSRAPSDGGPRRDAAGPSHETRSG